MAPLSVLRNPPLERLLASLHARSDAQIEAIRRGDDFQWDVPSLSADELAAHRKHIVSDKFFALDREKAELCYQLCRATRARRIVEIGTSYGVSTLYLAAALGDTIAANGGTGIVIGTEYEAAKARVARAHFDEAGLTRHIDLREGDFRETLANLDGPIDFVLIDIWPDCARPALELVAPHLADGAIVACDNTAAYREAYADYFAFINEAEGGFRTITLPYEGGFELSVRSSR